MNMGTKRCMKPGARGQAIIAPKKEPAAKEIRVEIASSPTVQGKERSKATSTFCG